MLTSAVTNREEVMNFETRLHIFATHAERLTDETKSQTVGRRNHQVPILRSIAERFLDSIDTDSGIGESDAARFVKALENAKMGVGGAHRCYGACRVLAAAPTSAMLCFTSEGIKHIANCLLELMTNESEDLRTVAEMALLNMFGKSGFQDLVLEGKYPSLRKNDQTDQNENTAE